MALRELKEKGAKVVSVVNVVDSSIARESDGVVYIQAGPEIGVASTKAYTLQILTITLIAAHFADVRGGTSEHELIELRRAMLGLPEQAQKLIEREDDVKSVAAKYFEAPDALYLGRGVNLPSAMEGALKLKEISYIPCRGLLGG